MVPSANLFIALMITKVTVRAPEGLYHRALLAHDLLWNMCTDSAKVMRTKSRRYGADFELMCKSLQQNVAILGTADMGRAAMDCRLST